MASIQQPAINEDYLQARLHQDWKEFESKGRSLVEKAVPKANRTSFHDECRKLQKAHCCEDVLFPCLYVWLNSRKVGFFLRSKELSFPWKEDVKAITSQLDRVRRKMEKLEEWSGFATLMNGNGCWDSDFGLDLDGFEEFKVVHEDLLGTMDRYIVELENLRGTLPRKDIVTQYGQAVIWTYVSLATQSTFSRASSLTESLLGCFYTSDPPEINWTRVKQFQDNYPLFCTRANFFLSARHDTAKAVRNSTGND